MPPLLIYNEIIGHKSPFVKERTQKGRGLLRQGGREEEIHKYCYV
jgi:hypothetical protein